MFAMDKLVLACALTTCTVVSHADLNVTTGDVNLKMSGVIDTGIASVTNVKGGTQTKTTGVDSILGVSNLGISGDYQIDDNYSAYFKLQAGFNPSKGEQSKDGELFDRNAYVGLKTPYGSVSLGKQWTFNDDWFVGSVFKGGYNSGAMFKFSEFDAVSEIYSNLIKYTSPNFNGLQIGAIYGLKDDSDKNTHGQIFTTAVKYDAQQWMVGAGYEYHEAQDTDNHYELTTLAGKYQMDQWIARLGLAYADISGPGKYAAIASNLEKQKAWSSEIGVDYLMTPKFTLSADILYRKNTTFDTNTTVYRALAIYQLRQPISLLANIAYLNNADGASESLVNTDSGLQGGGYTDKSQLSTALGIRLTF
ncbi:porin [Acinetobacter puyangensis]|uniref:Outer membrane protein (Porin) n=1 Tax=Acinetobacter puyangensis TaxID=1096779 RepID=A0A240E5S5_9GAMM|nr:porin [Acinetobacter puyangensis]SNX43926.1 Outer membrane protein (porin) [Acinetobacter puyangensis]